MSIPCFAFSVGHGGGTDCRAATETASVTARSRGTRNSRPCDLGELLNQSRLLGFPLSEGRSCRASLPAFCLDSLDPALLIADDALHAHDRGFELRNALSVGN